MPLVTPYLLSARHRNAKSVVPSIQGLGLLFVAAFDWVLRVLGEI